MPQIETITDDIGNPMEIINIDCTVGENGVNDPNDVKVVKALLKCIPTYFIKPGKHGKVVSWNSVGDSSWNVDGRTIPSPYDGTTWGIPQLIRSFQKYANQKLSQYGYKVNVSGRVKPAGKFAVVGKNYSTLAALHVFAELGARNSDGAIEYILNNFGDTFDYLVEDPPEDSDQ